MRSDRKSFVSVCEEFLNTFPIENELNYVEMNKDRAKMEQIDNEIVHVLKKREVKKKERRKE